MNRNYLWALMKPTPPDRVHHVVTALAFTAFAAEELLSDYREGDAVRSILENGLRVAAYENAGEEKTLGEFIEELEQNGDDEKSVRDQ